MYSPGSSIAAQNSQKHKINYMKLKLWLSAGGPVSFIVDEVNQHGLGGKLSLVMLLKSLMGTPACLEAQHSKHDICW